MKVRIVSDGTNPGTHVMAAGDRIENVSKVVWTIDARDGLARATVELNRVAVELHAERGAEPAEAPASRDYRDWPLVLLLGGGCFASGFGWVVAVLQLVAWL